MSRWRATLPARLLICRRNKFETFRNVQPISDVYALGMTAYSLLTGTIALDLPFQAGIAETVKAIFEKPVVPIMHRVQDVPPNFAYVVERALAKNPDQRWASAAEMRNALIQTLQN